MAALLVMYWKLVVPMLTLGIKATCIVSGGRESLSLYCKQQKAWWWAVNEASKAYPEDAHYGSFKCEHYQCKKAWGVTRKDGVCLNEVYHVVLIFVGL